MSSELDYEALTRAMNESIASLSAYRIARSAIRICLKSQLVNGGFGDVQRATLRGSGSRSTMKVAVKMMRPTGNENQRLRVAVALARELRIWSRLLHPNVIPLVGFYFDLDRASMWLLSRWETFGNIVEYLEENEVDQETRLNLAMDTAAGLAYLHTRKPAVCHGDIKGANVIISQEKRAMWCDFGLARAMEEDPSGLTTSRGVMGTTRYLSPELLEDSPGSTLESDVWAWGCVLGEITTSRTPYAGERTDSLVIRAIMRGKRPASLDDPSIPRFAAEMLAKCWSTEPGSRPTMTWCSEFFPWQTAKLFNACYGCNLDRIPPSHKSEGDGWCAVRNPASPRTYEFRFASKHLQSRSRRFAFSPDRRGIVLPTGQGLIRDDFESNDESELVPGEFEEADFCFNYQP